MAKYFSLKLLRAQRNCHPDRSVPGFPATRHSPASTCAAFSKESRMKFANATNLDRKSGVAQWRDLLFIFQFSHRLFRAGLKFGYRPYGPGSDLRRARSGDRIALLACA